MHYIVKFISQMLIKKINFYGIFLNFGQILIDNHKLVMIPIFIFFSKHDKNKNFVFL
jgi:hypothetical protein